MLDTVVTPALLTRPGPYLTVVKQSLLDYPAMGIILRSLDAIAVSRENPREDLRTVLTEGGKALESGTSVLLFPQHTRDSVFRPATFNSLGAKLAGRASVPLVPIALKTDFLGLGKVIRDFGAVDRSRTVHMSCGPPIQVEDNGKKAHRRAVEFIAAELRAWGGAVE
jgi:1-acyl-sn-glycerol-3-phosphate acyltransferase